MRDFFFFAVEKCAEGNYAGDEDGDFKKDLSFILKIFKYEISSMKMECEHCGAILKTISSLNQHQKTAKYCLVKQNKPINTEYTCCFCNAEFTLKSSLHKHVRICKANTPMLREQLQLLNEQFHELSLLKKDLLRDSEIVKVPYSIDEFQDDKPFKSKRLLHESYPISSEYFISFDEAFHRECIRDVLNNSQDLTLISKKDLKIGFL
jgi:hypothetical protein